MEDYLSINKQAWNQVVDKHFESEFYDVKNFINGKDPLNEPELTLLGDIRGKTILHLQCHFGMDTLALVRKGASVSGIDFSEKAIEKARELSQMVHLDAEFICSDIYSLNISHDKLFDIVFTSYGTIGWLPDLDRWASVLSKHLRKGGIFVMADFHPMIWMFDKSFSQFQYSYFNIEKIREEEQGSYADTSSEKNRITFGWNHPISEILNSLINAGFELQSFNEFDYSPYSCFENCVRIEDRKYKIAHLQDKVPMMYSIKAIKR